MKPKEYIKKFNLQNGWEQSQADSFLTELTNELAATFELFGKPDDINAFNHALDQISDKWDSISKRIPFGLPDKLWNYFYATDVIGLRKMVCPTFTKRQKENEDEYRRKRREDETLKREQEQEWEDIRKKSEKAFYESCFNDYFNFFLGIGAALLHKVPENSFSYFGLQSNASEEDVLEKFHEKILKVHPDKGGSKELAVECIENKNKCMSYLQNNK